MKIHFSKVLLPDVLRESKYPIFKIAQMGDQFSLAVYDRYDGASQFPVYWPWTESSQNEFNKHLSFLAKGLEDFGFAGDGLEPACVINPFLSTVRTVDILDMLADIGEHSYPTKTSTLNTWRIIKSTDFSGLNPERNRETRRILRLIETRRRES